MTCLWVRTLALSVLFYSFAAGAQDVQLPDGPGKEVMERLCSQCHAANLSVQKGNTREGWTQVVGEMIARGAQGSDEEFATVVDYLTTNFPQKADAKKVNVNKADAAELQKTLELVQKDAIAVVDYRKQKGEFKTFDDLKKVPGIDAAKWESVKQKIEF